MKGHEVLLEKLAPLRKFLQKGAISESDIEIIKNELESIPFFSSLIYKSHIDQVQRVTINKRLPGNNNERIMQINYLKNPPSHVVTRFGRLNLPQQSVLYATFEPLTALAEMRPEVGDMISISTWKADPDKDLAISPVFKNTTVNGLVHNELSLRLGILYRKFLKEHDEETGKQIDILIQFMADFFAKTVDDNNHLDYFVSAYYASKLLYVFENGEVDAIIYPSVRQGLTLSNIAIKPEVFNSNYSLTSIKESIIRVIPADNGGWVMDGTGSGKGAEGSEIIWD